GPYIGLGTRVLFATLNLFGLVALVVVALAWRWARRARLSAFVLGHCVSVALFFSGAKDTLYEWRWTRRCAHGESRACGAVGNLHAYKRHDIARAQEYWRRWCAIDDVWSCEAVLEVSPNAADVCASLERLCEGTGPPAWPTQRSACEAERKGCSGVER